MARIPVYVNGTAEWDSNNWFICTSEVVPPAGDTVTISPECDATGNLIFYNLMSCGAARYQNFDSGVSYFVDPTIPFRPFSTSEWEYGITVVEVAGMVL